MTRLLLAALPLSLVALSAFGLVGCGLANGATAGDLESPFYSDNFINLGGGTAPPPDDANVGDSCDDSADCYGAALLCDYETATCQEPDDVQHDCAIANELGSHEDDGPLIYDAFFAQASLIDPTPFCVAFEMGYYHPGNPAFEELTDTEASDGLDFAYTVPSGAVQLYDVYFSSDDDGEYVGGLACGDNIPPIELAFQITDPDGQQSNTVCADSAG